MDITIENIKRIWLTDEAVHIETVNGKIGEEHFSEYPALRYATAEQRKRYTTSPFGIHWEEIDMDLSFEGFFKSKSKKQTEIAQIFNKLQELNVSAFARRLGISQPLMAAYLNGSKSPGEKRKKEIEKELHRLGEEFLKVSFSS